MSRLAPAVWWAMPVTHQKLTVTNKTFPAPKAPATYVGGGITTVTNDSSILFVVSEVAPIIRTGGLADVANGLPRALKSAGHPTHLAVPAYPEILESLRKCQLVAELSLPLGDVRVHSGLMPDSDIPVLAIDHDCFSSRRGCPYNDEHGIEWADNASRFALFNQAVVEISMDRAGLDYKPELVHCNDWHTGLVPALLSLEKDRPATVFTVHNLKHQGLFSRNTFKTLGLPEQWWAPNALEFYGGFSFMKAGLVFADRINTVSPAYAQEIQSARYGNGLDGVLSERAEHLWGILNGIDTQLWDPTRSPHLSDHFDAYQLEGKASVKQKLQVEMGLEQRADTLLIAMATRLDEQKGIDVALQALQNNPQLDFQVAVMAHGSGPLVQELQAFAERHPGRVAVHHGFDESFSHRLFAAADSFLIPSRFEPCGLTQMFAMRFGTLPIAHRVGGLKDTVFDNASGHARSNGFAIDELNADLLGAAIARAVECHRTEPVRWNRLQQNAMGWEFSWRRAARGYLAYYADAIAANAANQKSHKPAFQLVSS